jgi:hypothetical protein
MMKHGNGAAVDQESHDNAPLNWYRAILPVSVRRVLATMWLGLLAIFALSLSSAMFAAIFGYIPVVSNLFTLRGSDLTGFLYALGYFMLGLLPLTFLAGFARDGKRV